MPDNSVEGTKLIPGEIQETLLEPFIAAVGAALGEMASIEVVPRAVYRRTQHNPTADIAAVLRIMSATEGLLILGFPERTARALASRILAGSTNELETTLIRD